MVEESSKRKSDSGGVDEEQQQEKRVITEDEAALYDRQIRLWGLDAQNRLRNADVLLVGLSGLGAEIAKNLMLAGLRSLTLMDDCQVTELDQRCQFLAPVDAIGENRAKASLERCQQLNPMVRVKLEAGTIDEKDDAFFRQYHVICLTNQNVGRMERTNEMCRRNGVRFVAGGVYGSFGFSFEDFLEFEFFDETETQEVSSEEVDLIDSPVRKKARHDSEHDRHISRAMEHFASFKDAFNGNWKIEGKLLKKTGRLPSTFIVIQSLLRYENETGELPTQKDVKKLTEIWEEMKVRYGALPSSSSSDQIEPEQFLEYSQGQLSPVCAIVGGIMGQEIIKAASQKDRPLNNTFLYDAFDSSGRVIRIPPIID